MRKPFLLLAAALALLGVFALRRILVDRREQTIINLTAAETQTHLNLLTVVPNHEEHMGPVEDAFDELKDADDMPTLLAGLRQLLQVSRRAHALAVGADMPQ